MITLTFNASLNSQNPTRFAALMAGVVLDHGELDMLGLTVNTDTTTADGTGFHRVVTLNESARFLAENQTPEAREAAVKNLFSSVLALPLFTRIVEVVS